MNIFKKSTRFLAKIDNPETPLTYYILGSVAWLLLYNFLEIFSDPGMVTFKLLTFSNILAIPASVSIAIHFLHVALWWVAVGLVVPITLTLLSQEKITNTLRVTLSFSWLIILTPLTDLIVSKGKGIDIHYIYPQKITDLFLMPFQFTPGENLTMLLALYLVAKYCLVKTKKIGKTLTAVFTVIIALGLAALLPFFIRSLANIFNITLEGITPIPVIRILALVIFLESLFILYLKNKAYFLSLLKDAGGFKSLNFILFFILGILLFKGHTGRLLLENLGSFLLSAAAIFLVWVFANVVSHINSEPKNNTHKASALGIILLAGLCALSVNFTTLFFILLGASLAGVYLLAPFKLKQFPLFSKIIISFCLLLLVMLGWLFAGGEIFHFPQIFSLYILVFFSVCLNFVDIKDYASDKKAGIKTLAVELGEKKTKYLIGLAFLVSYLVIPLLFRARILFLPSLLLGLIQVYLINRKNFREDLVFAVYLAGLVSLLIWLNFFRLLS